MTARQPLERLPFQPVANCALHWYLDEQRALFDLDAPYQRGSVWTLEQRQRLIESLLMGLPIGAIVYADRGLGQYVVIDGKQRVEAIRAFVDDEVPVHAWWFDEDERTVSADGVLLHSDLTRQGMMRVKMFAMPGLLARVKTIADEARIFDLINTGGTAQDETTIARAREIAAGAA